MTAPDPMISELVMNRLLIKKRYKKICTTAATPLNPYFAVYFTYLTCRVSFSWAHRTASATPKQLLSLILKEEVSGDCIQRILTALHD